jgi:hypothetical protein
MHNGMTRTDAPKLQLHVRISSLPAPPHRTNLNNDSQFFFFNGGRSVVLSEGSELFVVRDIEHPKLILVAEGNVFLLDGNLMILSGTQGIFPDHDHVMEPD